MKILCAGGCGRLIWVRKKHQGADNNQYWCFFCCEAGLAPQSAGKKDK